MDSGPLDLIDRYETAWSSMRVDAMCALWDRSHAEPFYLAEEMKVALTTHGDIESYWTRTFDYLTAINVRTTNLRVIPLGDTLDLISFDMHHDTDLKIYEAMGYAPLGGNVRVVAIARRTPSGSRFIAYAEASMGPLAMVRTWLESQLSPDFQPVRGAP